VLHVPSISKPLFSISQLIADNNIYVEFDRTTHKVLIRGIKHNGLYLLSCSSHQALVCEQDSISLCHTRPCHASKASLHHLLSINSISCKFNKLRLCDSCCLAKSHRLSFTNSSTTTTKLLQLVNCDVWGPSPIISHTGYRYYVLFTDNYSRFSWIYFCIHKSDVAFVFAQFKLLVENILSSSIKTMQIVGGTEFLPLIKSYPSIQFHISRPYTSQQNGLVERKHRHIVELSLASMFHAKIPQVYWPEVFESVTFVINRLPSFFISFIILYHVLFDSPLDYKFFKVLVCMCYPYTRPYTSHKLNP
jgi:hypothetical protein